MRKKIAILALSIFALGAMYTMNAENTEVKEVKATKACGNYRFSCGKVGTVCSSGNLQYAAYDIDELICGSPCASQGKVVCQGDSGGPLPI